MDEQLKRRLMGAAIVTALAVIFVPMLFEDKSAVPSDEVSEMPALPRTVEETAIELPKSAADVVPAEPQKSESKPAKRATDSNYRIIPMEDEPPKPAKVQPPSSAAVPVAEAGMSEGEDFAADEGGEASMEQPAAGPGIPAAPKAALAPDKPAEATAKAVPGKKEKAKPMAAQSPETTEPGKAKALPPVAEDQPATRPAAPKSKPAPAPAKPLEKPKAATAPNPRTEPSTVKTAAPKPASAAPSADADDAAPPPAKSPAAKTGAKPAPAPPKPPAAKPKEPNQAASNPPAGAPSAWVVQAGSFTGEANARALADKLRKQNLPAYVHVSRKESGDVYRVTVGPELNRARAEQIRGQIEGAVGIKGLILPHR